MDNKTVATMVVTYNRKEMLKECIEALLKQTYKKQQIYIIDNASTDGTKDYIKKYIDSKKVFYYNTGKNSGGAGGFNYGVREALKNKVDYAWLMDDDSIAEDKNALKSLVDKAAFLEDDFSFLSSIVKWTDGKICQLNKQTLDGAWDVNFDKINHGLIPVKTASFVSFFANMQVVKKVGLPIKDFFIYFDDNEYSLRLNKIKPSYIDVDSIMIHKSPTNQSSSVTYCDENKINRLYMQYRNEGYILRKHIPMRDHFNFRYNYILNVLSVLRFSKNHKAKRIWYYTKGKIAGRFFNPKIEME